MKRKKVEGWNMFFLKVWVLRFHDRYYLALRLAKLQHCVTAKQIIIKRQDFRIYLNVFLRNAKANNIQTYYWALMQTNNDIKPILFIFTRKTSFKYIQSYTHDHNDIHSKMIISFSITTWLDWYQSIHPRK